MQALIDNASKDVRSPPFLNIWLEYATSSYERFKICVLKNADLSPCNLLSRINVLQQLDNLKTYPLVKERLQSNKLRIHGWWFDLATANVYHYDQNSEEFVLIDESEAENILTPFN